VISVERAIAGHPQEAAFRDGSDRVDRVICPTTERYIAAFVEDGGVETMQTDRGSADPAPRKHASGSPSSLRDTIQGGVVAYAAHNAQHVAVVSGIGGIHDSAMPQIGGRNLTVAWGGSLLQPSSQSMRDDRLTATIF